MVAFWRRFEFVQSTPIGAFDSKHEEHDDTDQKNRDVDNLS